MNVKSGFCQMLWFAALLVYLESGGHPPQLPGNAPVPSLNTWITTTLVGHVSYGPGNPVGRAKIAFRNESTGAIKRTRTDENGRYIVTMSPGRYTVTVEARGFRSLTTSLSVS